MKKVCFITPDDLSSLTFAPSFAKILNGMPNVEFITIEKMTIFQKEFESLNWRHIPIEMNQFLNPLEDIKYFWNLFRIIKNEKIDVVITFATKPNIYGSIAARLAGVPKITVAVRGMGRTFEKPQNLKDKLFRAIMGTLYRFAFRCCDFVWFTNIGDQLFCIEKRMIEKEKTILTKNAINLKYFSKNAVPPDKTMALREKLGFAQNDSVVIMVARLIWSKGIKEFVESAEILRESLPHLKFLLVASIETGSHKVVPISYINKMKKRSNLTWLEFSKEMRNLYALSDLAVLPSYYKEGGYPRALLEPMAFGKPVIAADTHDCRSPVEHGKNGFLVKPRDSNELALRIKQIISNPELARKFGERSLHKVYKEHDDRVVAKNILNRLSLLTD